MQAAAQAGARDVRVMQYIARNLTLNGHARIAVQAVGLPHSRAWPEGKPTRGIIAPASTD